MKNDPAPGPSSELMCLPATVRPYPRGIDYIWIASDREGHMAAFMTGGVGPVPHVVLDSSSQATDNLDELLVGLPLVSAARLLVSVKRTDDLIALNERGLFVFDWTDVERTQAEARRAYEKLSVPERPVARAALPCALANVAVDLKDCGVTFMLSRWLDVSSLVPCRS